MSASWWSAVTAWRSFSFHLLFNQLQLIDEREDVMKEKILPSCYDSPVSSLNFFSFICFLARKRKRKTIKREEPGESFHMNALSFFLVCGQPSVFLLGPHKHKKEMKENAHVEDIHDSSENFHAIIGFIFWRSVPFPFDRQWSQCMKNFC